MIFVGYWQLEDEERVFPNWILLFRHAKNFRGRVMSRHKILNPAAARGVKRDTCALAIMTKLPQAGKVKTRLTPPLTPSEAANLNTCFLRDLGQSIAQAATQSLAHGVGVFTPADAGAAYSGILPDAFFLIPQRGDDFDERLVHAAEDLFKVGFHSVCLINSDSPTVPASSFIAAVDQLGKPGDRIVLGPSDDGGYYLIGLKRMHHEMFEGIDWSTERVLEQSRQRAADLGLPVQELPPGFDVDDRVSLKRLCQELLDDKTRTATQAASSTRRFLAGIIKREGRDRIWAM
jgi:rSAM/selenodomain-associated transferase 1